MTQIERLRKVSALKYISFKKQKQFVDQSKPIKKIRGQYIYREGDPATHVYIVASGQIRITKKISTTRPTYIQKPD